MESIKYLKMLAEDIHSAVIATLDEQGRPATRVIDIMLYDEQGIYFLTAKGKAFYHDLMTQKYISLSAVKEKKSISLRGSVQNIGSEKLEEIFEKNTYMQKIYPEGTRDALEVFHLYEAAGEFFDISDPAHIERGEIHIGQGENLQKGYFVSEKCTGCGACLSVCPQKCITMEEGRALIAQNHCLHCGRCMEACPCQAIVRK